MSPKNLVLLVEGEGDVLAAPILLKRLLVQELTSGSLILDPNPIRVGEFSGICKDTFAKWKRLLQVALKRRNVGGCLLILDGDSKVKTDGQPFCANRAAMRLAEEASQVGAGKLFSVGIVFACMEFESWLIAGAPSLVGKSFTDSRKEILSLANDELPSDPEHAPRDAKRWLSSRMLTGYKPTRDQAELTRLVDLDMVRRHRLRSFIRLESALEELVVAMSTDRHLVTPRRQR